MTNKQRRLHTALLKRKLSLSKELHKVYAQIKICRANNVDPKLLASNIDAINRCIIKHNKDITDNLPKKHYLMVKCIFLGF